MSVYIKGMAMPKNCDDCFLSEWSTCNERFYCMFDDCPLVEIPVPHGRLIDGDALQFKVDNIGCFYEVLGVTEDTIDSAPTVIEAEGEP